MTTANPHHYHSLFPLCLALFTSPASAIVISDTQINFSAGTWPGVPSANYGVGIKQNSTGNLTGIGFAYGGTTLSVPSFAIAIDEASDWYLVQVGDNFSPQTIAANQFTTLYKAPAQSGFTIQIPLGNFYLGIATGEGIINSQPNRTAFGWIELHNSGGALTHLANAMSYNEPGIIIGTTTLPTSALLLATPVATLLLRRQKFSR